MSAKACVVGAGPNGLSAAIVLAQAGLDVDVFESEPQAGGAARTLELTLPGFHHDFGSAVHPLGIGSPFFSSLPLRDLGLEWIHSPAELAHPFDDGTAIAVERDPSKAESWFGEDGRAWRKLLEPFAKHWKDLADDILRPIRVVPRHPILLARFGMHALLSATTVARSVFRNERTRAVFAGLAAHSLIGLNEISSAASGMLFGATLHSVGWPIPRSGAQSITDALCQHLRQLGGRITTGVRIEQLASLPKYDVMLCDVTPRQLLKIADDRLSPSYRTRLAEYQYGPGAFKVDYALSEPIPWKASECRRAATVHIGGTLQEIAASEDCARRGKHSERPFILLAQPTLFDPSRAPAGKHVAWAYCHVPNGCSFDMLYRFENQIERFAPGFRDCVLERRVSTPALLESMDANLVGGDIGGGLMNLRQLLFRPTWRHYSTSAKGLYICSASTPPGGGVHGMCGYNAARLALARWKT